MELKIFPMIFPMYIQEEDQACGSLEMATHIYWMCKALKDEFLTVFYDPRVILLSVKPCKLGRGEEKEEDG